MNQIIVAVKDTAVQSFSRPVFVPTIAVATRSFRDEVNGNRESDVFKHPDDFELYELGSFDDQDGVIHPITPRLVCRAKDLKEST